MSFSSLQPTKTTIDSSLNKLSGGTWENEAVENRFWNDLQGFSYASAQSFLPAAPVSLTGRLTVGPEIFNQTTAIPKNAKEKIPEEQSYLSVGVLKANGLTDAQLLCAIKNDRIIDAIKIIKKRNELGVHEMPTRFVQFAASTPLRNRHYLNRVVPEALKKALEADYFGINDPEYHLARSEIESYVADFDD